MLNVRRSALLAVAALVALLGPPGASADETVQGGLVRIPMAFKYAGEVHAKGPYQLRIEPGKEGPYVVLAADGKELVRELAIVQERGGRMRTARVAVHVLTRDEHMVRIIVRHGTKRYLAYFETTS
jgi:hypothetical protein